MGNNVTSHPGANPQKAENLELWKKAEHYRDAIVAKLLQTSERETAIKLAECHTRKTTCLCNDCGTASAFMNRCDLLVCPVCAPRLARKRGETLEWWGERIAQPKHVVLTLRNIDELTGQALRLAKKHLAALRRRAFAKNWRGGCWSLEITREGKGWHIHFHLLVDANWIDQAKLSQEWQSVTAGGGRIVYVKDVRSGDYRREVLKYVAKGSEVAGWTGQAIAEYVRALKNQRTFGVFGTLRGAKAEKAAFDEAREKDNRCKCPHCQSVNVKLYDEHEWLEFTETTGYGARPPTRPPVIVGDRNDQGEFFPF